MEGGDRLVQDKVLLEWRKKLLALRTKLVTGSRKEKSHQDSLDD